MLIGVLNMVAMPQQLVAIPEQLKAYYNDFSCPDQVYEIARKCDFFGCSFRIIDT